MAWSNPNPSSFTLQLKDVLPPLPVAAALPVPEFIQDEGDATAEVQAVEIPIAVVPRRMGGRPKHNALEVVLQIIEEKGEKVLPNYHLSYLGSNHSRGFCERIHAAIVTQLENLTMADSSLASFARPWFMSGNVPEF